MGLFDGRKTKPQSEQLSALEWSRLMITGNKEGYIFPLDLDFMVCISTIYALGYDPSHMLDMLINPSNGRCLGYEVMSETHLSSYFCETKLRVELGFRDRDELLSVNRYASKIMCRQLNSYYEASAKAINGDDKKVKEITLTTLVAAICFAREIWEQWGRNDRYKNFCHEIMSRYKWNSKELTGYIMEISNWGML